MCLLSISHLFVLSSLSIRGCGFLSKQIEKVNHKFKQSDWLISFDTNQNSYSKIFTTSLIVFIISFNRLYLLNEQCYSEQWCKDAPFGTWVRIKAILDPRTFLSAGNSCAEAVETAIKAGYRLIDTASAYRNHKEVGAAIKKCIDEGVVKREDLFITTKLRASDWKPDDVDKAIENILKELQTPYIDLFLIHHSSFFNLAPEEEKKRREGNFFDSFPYPTEGCEKLGFNIDLVMQTWGKLEEYYHKGILRAIGVSNYTSKRLQLLLDRCTVKPAVNQVELHPYLQQWEVKDLLDKNGMYFMAFFPLGGADRGVSHKYASPMKDPVIARIAEEHHKTPAQIMIRWAIQRGTICIPKSVHKERILENFNVFDFSLTEENMKDIRALDKGYRFANPSFLFPEPADGNMVWDGEYVN